MPKCTLRKKQIYDKIVYLYSQIGKNPTDLIENLPLAVIKKNRLVTSIVPRDGTLSPIADTDQGIEYIISMLFDLNNPFKKG